MTVYTIRKTERGNKFVDVTGGIERPFVEPEQEKILIQEEMQDRVFDAVNNLTPNQREAVIMRYGLFGSDESSYSYIGDVFHITGTGAGRHVRKALIALQ